MALPKSNSFSVMVGFTRIRVRDNSERSTLLNLLKKFRTHKPRILRDCINVCAVDALSLKSTDGVIGHISNSAEEALRLCNLRVNHFFNVAPSVWKKPPLVLFL
jgi:hypothetical protein